MIDLLYGWEITCFQENKSRAGKWGCFPIVDSCCCNIQKGKDISEVKHGVAVCAQCIWCMKEMKGI